MHPDPPPSEPETPTNGPAPSRRSRLRSIVGFVIGAGLFAAAIFVVVSGWSDFRGAFREAAGAPWWLIAAGLGLPVLNWLFVSLAFLVLTRRFGRVGVAEMAAITGAAWLLNYLPLRPGLVGRFAYHKRVNRIAVKDTARVVIWSGILSIAAAGMLLLVAIGLGFGRMHMAAWAWLCAPLALILTGVGVGARFGGGRWRTGVALLFKYLDMLAWVARYVVVFRIIGRPLEPADAVLVAVVSQATLLVPITGNGLGLREWGVRLTTTKFGLVADMINRAAELAVAVPIGLAASLWLARRMAAAPAHAPPQEPAHEPVADPSSGEAAADPDPPRS